MLIGENLRKLREQQGISLRTMEKRIGISHNTLGSYERNYAQPTIENYFKLVEYFEIPFDYLVYGEKTKGDLEDSELRDLLFTIDKMEKRDREIIKKYLKKYVKAYEQLNDVRKEVEE